MPNPTNPISAVPNNQIAAGTGTLLGDTTSKVVKAESLITAGNVPTPGIVTVLNASTKREIVARLPKHDSGCIFEMRI